MAFGHGCGRADQQVGELFSRRMVNARQNTDTGKALKGFSTYSRVLEGDRFLVWIR
ncbi:hypothetical protein [Streptomyces coeruleorubidus]|uniref:hypothetical protein n=1 Tax=Streptomyces coeruleorubidus TaxID=116188 RepID=UPI00368AE0E4